MAKVRYKNRTLIDSNDKLPSLPPQKKLSGAMHAVDQALTEQRAELRTFQDKMAELSGAMKDMRKNIDEYSDSVEKIDIEALRARARKIRDDADDS
jgi:ABC-type transporter Mla subunit MlaD